MATAGGHEVVVNRSAKLDHDIAAALKSVSMKKLFGWRPKLKEAIVDVDEGRLSHSGDAPLTVSRLDTPRGTYMILDGYHRAIEAIRAGRMTIPVELDKYVPRIERAGGAFGSYVTDKVNVYEHVKK